MLYIHKYIYIYIYIYVCVCVNIIKILKNILSKGQYTYLYNAYQLYNKNQWNAEFSKLTFNFCCILHVSKLLVSSSGRQLYMKYGTLCMYRCEQSGGLESVFKTLLSTILLTPMHVKHAVLHIQLTPWGWIPQVSKHVGDNKNSILI